MARRLVARENNYGGQTRVYRTPEGLEIDEAEDDRILRKRLFWDEVLLVTLHKAGDVPFIVIAIAGIGTLALIVLGIGAALGTRTGVGLSLVTWVPLAVYTVLRMVRGVPTVSVYGRRTAARLPFPLRPERAREVFNEMSSAARRRQEAARIALARKAGPPGPPAA